MEWEYQSEIELGYLIFRALINTMSMLKRIGFPAMKTYEKNINYTDFIKNIFKEYGFNLSFQELKRYSDLESQVQEFVSGSEVNLFDHLQNSKLFFNTSALFNNKDEEINFLKNDLLFQEKEIQLLTQEKISLKEVTEHLKNDNNDQLEEIQLLIKEKISLENSIQKIFSSTSWKITKPIRFLKKKIKELKEQIMRIF